jgi:peptidoglycan/xylan/chitin deacetylase (PgdA/CDA1 family)
MLRNLVKTGVARTLGWTGIDRLLGAIWRGNDSPLVLGYHRVVEDFAAYAPHTIPSMLISRSLLERQLDWVGQRYHFVSLDDLGASMLGQKRFSKPIAALTFDDGYRDVYDNALPLLKRKGIPAAVFVMTDLVGTRTLPLHDKLFLLLKGTFAPGSMEPRALTNFMRGFGLQLPGEEIFVDDPSRTVNSILASLPQSEIHRIVAALERRTGIEEEVREMHRTLSWEMVEEMHRAGVTIGSHSKSHVILTVEKMDKVMDETEGSKKELERRLGTEIRHFAYPDGRFNKPALEAVADSGYRFAYTTSRHGNPDYPLLTIPRLLLWEKSSINAHGNFSGTVLSCQIHGIFDLLSRSRFPRVPRVA